MKKNIYGLLSVFVLFLGCSDPFQKLTLPITNSNDIAADMGRIVVTIGTPGNERTVMPQEAITIAEYGIVIIRQGETVPCWSNTGSSLSVTADLPQGTYTVSVSGYNENNQLTAVGDGEVTIIKEQTSSILIQLKTSGNDAGNGTFCYSLDLADDVLFQYGFISLYTMPSGVLSHSLQFFDTEGSFYYPAGYYRMTVSAWIIKDGVMQTKTKTAVVHLYVRHEITVALELDENSGAIGNEYTVSNAAELDTALNSIKNGVEKNVIITVTANFSHAPISLSDAGYNNKTISLRSDDPDNVRAITLSGNGSLFTAGSEQSSPSLVLSNIKLAGHGSNNVPLVTIVKGTVIVNNGAEISGNTNNNSTNVYRSGGGIAVENGALLKMYGGTVKNNTLSNTWDARGGGVVVRGNFEQYGGAIENNRINGISIYGGGVMVDDGGIFKQYGGNIRNNELNSTNQSIGGCGVAVRGTFEMYGGSIDHHVYTGTRQIKGGGIYIAASGIVVMNGGEIAYNEIERAEQGAGIYTEGNFTFNAGKVYENSITEVGGYGDKILAGYGGGIYYKSGSFSLKGGEIYRNSARYGGGICINSYSTLDEVYIYENTARRGAGIYSDNITLNIKNCTIENNTILAIGETKAMGAGICSLRGTIVMDGGTISGNRINMNVYSGNSNTYPDDACGGGIAFALDGSFTMNGGLIKDNEITGFKNAYGAGVYVEGTGTVTLGNGQILNNTATAPAVYGAGVYAIGNITMNGTQIAFNNAGNSAGNAYGGGLYTEGNFTFTNGLITGNDLSLVTGTSEGGGVYVKGSNGAITMSGGRVTANYAKNNGGGIYFNGASVFRMRSGIFNGNSADRGGGIYLGTSSGGFEKNFYGVSATCGIIYGNEVSGTDEFDYDLKNTGTGAAIYYQSSKLRNTTVGETITLFQGNAENWTD
jgi:hypothetical protein